MIALNILVFSVDFIRKSSFYEAAARTAVFFVAPVQEAVSGVSDSAGEVWEHYFNLVKVKYENERLRRELRAARRTNHNAREMALENKRLRGLLGLKEKSACKFLAAEVVARDPSRWYRTIVINKGTSDGVSRDDPVLTEMGIVGHVWHTSAGHSTVILIIDRNSAADAMIQRNRTRGIARGTGSGRCRFEYSLRKKEVKINDVVISSGFDGIYPRGFRIGYVSKVVRRNTGLFQNVEITPFVNFRTLEEVMVLLNPPDYEVSEE